MSSPTSPLGSLLPSIFRVNRCCLWLILIIWKVSNPARSHFRIVTPVKACSSWNHLMIIWNHCRYASDFHWEQKNHSTSTLPPYLDCIQLEAGITVSSNRVSTRTWRISQLINWVVSLSISSSSLCHHKSVCCSNPSSIRLPDQSYHQRHCPDRDIDRGDGEESDSKSNLLTGP